MRTNIENFSENATFTTTQSPVGKLLLIAGPKGLEGVLWDVERFDGERAKEVFGRMRREDKNPILQQTKRELKEYFAGKRKKFEVKLSPQGTLFQKQAWKELSKIPYGKTISYQEQAKRVGSIRKVRAVGGANGRNPISIVVPCHRVIGKNGSLTGFGGGLDRKQLLLDLEARYRK